MNLNDLPRRRLDECFTEHPDVSITVETQEYQRIFENTFMKKIEKFI
jgi:hypothetical protein